MNSILINIAFASMLSIPYLRNKELWKFKLESEKVNYECLVRYRGLEVFELGTIKEFPFK